jgi:DNA-nicking Smr family endonuclease
LHGATLDEARARLDQFLQSCLSHQIKSVCIVHGKGYGSRDRTPVLKQTVRRWLTQIDAVLAYTECNEQNGGAGAVQVLLRTGANRNNHKP